MNKSIYSSSLKRSSVFIVIIIACVVITVISLIWLFPSIASDSSSYAKVLSTMPKGLLSAIGMKGNINNFNDFLNMNFYNSIYLYILMVFCIVLCTNLISKPIDDTSLVYYLNAPVGRVKFIISQIVVFVTGLIAVVLSSVVFSYIGKIILADKYDFNFNNFVKDNIMLGCIFLFLGGVTILIASSVKNNSDAVNWSSTIIVAEYLFDMVSKISDKVSWMKKITVFTFYNPDKIHDGTGFLLSRCGILLAATIIVIAIAIEIFKNRDLYL